MKIDANTSTAPYATPTPDRRDGRPWPRPADLEHPAAEHGRTPITALITTFNEESNIEDCIRSVSWCDEIMVVDSGSTDRTLEIAARLPKVRILERPYLGAASQKNWAIDRASWDWLLILDADERLTPELHREIEGLLEAGLHEDDAFSIPRNTYFLGRHMRFSGWQHDRVTRLFNRRSARYPNRRVHADMVTRKPVRILQNGLTHYMVDDLNEYCQRLQRYARWGAAQLWIDGRESGAWEVIVHPLWRFLRTYILQFGIVEGLPGLMLCAIHSWAVFLKWSILWGWRRNHGNGVRPDLPTFDNDPTTWAWPGSGEASTTQPDNAPVPLPRQP